MKDVRNIKKGVNRISYFAKNFGLYFLPDSLSEWLDHTSLKGLTDKEREEIKDRVSYYCKLPDKDYSFDDRSIKIEDFKFPFKEKKKHSTYFFDLYPHIRYHRPDMRFYYVAGDTDQETPVPTLVKSRPVTEGKSNSVLCKMDSIRHFRFITDRIPYKCKDDIIVSRNHVSQPWRVDLLEKYFGHPGTDFGQINNNGGRPEWIKPYLSIDEQLRHKFIICIRGNDVATNLKWVMSSNSVAVMPPADVESWYMEGRLKPDYHYIAIRPDYSDMMDKVEWFISHPDASEEIIRNAHEWIKQFSDKRKERVIMAEVIRNYFIQTGQL